MGLCVAVPAGVGTRVSSSRVILRSLAMSTDSLMEVSPPVFEISFRLGVWKELLARSLQAPKFLSRKGARRQESPTQNKWGLNRSELEQPPDFFRRKLIRLFTVVEFHHANEVGTDEPAGDRHCRSPTRFIPIEKNDYRFERPQKFFLIVGERTSHQGDHTRKAGLVHFHGVEKTF